jgi:hypothetical protein
MSSWSSYPSIFALGHRAIKDLLSIDVNVEEKVDGSQFSFGLIEVNRDSTGMPVDTVDFVKNGVDYALKVRSKGCVMHVDAPEALFKEACGTVRRLMLELHPGWTYRGEVLKKPHHNALTYERVPKSHIILFDINTGNQEYLSYGDKQREAERLELEVVPLLYSGRVETIEKFRTFLDTVSVLGGQRIEGVVVKPRNYDLYGTDKKVLFGKFVSEAFKEVHRKTWGESNPTNKDIITLLISTLHTPARWQKALIHLKEKGLIEGSPKDIGLIIKDVPEDILKEEEEWIKAKLFDHFWPVIRRGVTRGLPEWYKEQLLKAQFETEDAQATLEVSSGE